MSEYNLEFSEKLISAAQLVLEEEDNSLEAKRTVLYLSLLASEIALKALLERAGLPSKSIQKRSHSISALLGDLCLCQITCKSEDGNPYKSFVCDVMSIEVDDRFCDATVGNLLNSEELGASKYPNEIRYGDRIKEYSHALKFGAARNLVDWAREHLDDIRFHQSEGTLHG